MSWLHQIGFRLQPLFLKRKIEAELKDEVESHLAMMREANEAAGMPPAEARYAALREFGGIEQVKERYRDERGIRWLEDFFRDLGYAARSLRKAPGLTAVIVLSLALGIGANTAVFSFVDAVLLRPLPYFQPERLVRVQTRLSNGRWFAVPNGDFVDWREQNRVFEDMAAIRGVQATLTGSDEAERVQCQRVTGNYFALLGVRPVLGRTFLPDEETRPGAPVVVVSYRMWQRRFGLAPAIIGKKLTLDGTSCEIVGVMPAGFKALTNTGWNDSFTDRTDVWRPYPFGNEPMNERRFCMLMTIARLRPGTSVVQAQAEMDTIHARIQQEYRKGSSFIPKVIVKSMHEWLVEKDRQFYWVLLGAVNLVLLIAVANVANLLLARAAARQKEIAVRLALGAGRWRIVRQLLTEALLLALLGGTVGALVAVGSMGALMHFIPANTPRADEIGVDLRVLGFTASVTLLTGLMFGLAPALKVSKADLNDALTQGGRGAMGGAGRQVMRNALVVAEVGLAFVLLIGAGLMIQSLARLLAIDLGIRSDKILTMEITLPRSKYGMETGVSSGKPAAKVWAVRPEKMAFIEQVLQRIETLPGVLSAGVCSFLPFPSSRTPGMKIKVEGRLPQPNASEQYINSFSITPRYFDTMGMQLLRGRPITDRDREGAPGVTIVSEAMVREYWPNEDPIGKRVTQPAVPTSWVDGRDYEVVGIVADAKVTVEGGAFPSMFIPIDQQVKKYTDYGANRTLSLKFVVRTAGEPSAVAAAARAVIKEVDPNQPVEEIATMQQIISRELSARNFAMVLLSLFAGVAVVLSAAGIYGVMAYAVTQRTHEIGVRMALGASRRDVLAMVIRRGMCCALIGVAVGLAGALATTHLLKSLLYEITPTDPLTAVIVTLLLIGVALLACYIPARRATKVDPMVALRCE